MKDGLIYDWNRVDAGAKPPVVMLDDETLRDGLQSPSVRIPYDRPEDPHPAPHRRARHRHRRHRPAWRGPARRARRRAAGERDRLGASPRQGELRGANAHRRHRADRGYRAPHRCRRSNAAPSSGRAPIRQYAEGWTLDRLLRNTEEAITFAVERRPGGDARHRRHDARRSRHAARDLHLRDPRRRAARVYCGHGRPRDAGGRGGGGQVRRDR